MNSKQVIYLILTVLWFFLIIFFSSQVAKDSAKLSGGITERVIKIIQTLKVLPEGELEPSTKAFIHILIRKCAHFFVYAVLAIFLTLFYIHSDIKGRKLVVYVIITATLLASVDELYQTTIPGRVGQISDVLLDSMGAVFGHIFIVILRGILSIS